MSELEFASQAKADSCSGRAHLAICGWLAYIPDMSCQDAKRARHRQRQARYEARLRDGVALYPVPLGASEIDALVMLRWLPETAVDDRERVGEALATAFRELARKNL